MHEHRTHQIDRQLSKAQTIILFCTCAAAPALVGWLGAWLSGMTAHRAARAPFAPNGVASTLFWVASYALLGIALFLAITADTRHSGQRAVKMWSVSLWGAMFALALVCPFIMHSVRAYMLSFVWLVIIDAIAVALIVVNFKLRPSSAFLVMPFAALAMFMTFAAFYVAIYV